MNKSISKNQDNIDKLTIVHKNLLIIVGIMISLSLFAIFSKSKLEIKELQTQYFKLDEFYENHRIFERYFQDKKDLYWELNRTASNGAQPQENLPDYHSFLPLFSGRQPWGWNKELLDGRFNFKTIMEEVFIEDWNYWTDKGKERLRKRYYKNPNERNDKIEKFIDIKNRLKDFIKDEEFLKQFFVRNFEIKIFFIKDILQKYNITVEDSVIMSVSAPIKGDHNKSFLNFLNDSTRVSFYMISSLYTMLWGDWDIDFYELNESYNNICLKVYNKYIREKFLIYDQQIFNSNLPYASYIDKIERSRRDLELKLKGKFDHPSQLKPPFTPFEIDILIFYKSIFWVLLLFSIMMRNLFIYEDSIYEKQNIDKSEIEILPNLLNVLFLNFKKQRLALKVGLFVLLLLIILVIFFGINIQFYALLYSNSILFFFYVILPSLLSLILYFFKIKFNLLNNNR